jgi:hypothetical protein
LSFPQRRRNRSSKRRLSLTGFGKSTADKLVKEYQDDANFIQLLLDPKPVPPALSDAVKALLSFLKELLTKRRDYLIPLAASHVHQKRFAKVKPAVIAERERHQAAEDVRLATEYKDWINTCLALRPAAATAQ